MATYKRFEDLEVWQLARRLLLLIFGFTQKKDFYRDFKLKDQIKDSSGSTMDNIAEGFDREGNAEFIHFLTISKASNSEARSQLYRSYDRDYITEIEFREAFDLSVKIGIGLSKFITYIKNSGIKGNKFKRNLK